MNGDRQASRGWAYSRTEAGDLRRAVSKWQGVGAPAKGCVDFQIYRSEGVRWNGHGAGIRAEAVNISGGRSAEHVLESVIGAEPVSLDPHCVASRNGTM